MESQRSNRTRYLVIASRSCCRTAASGERRTKIKRHNSVKSVASVTAVPPGTPVAQRQLSVDSHRANQQLQAASQEETSKRLSGNTTTSRQNFKCDAEGQDVGGAALGASDGNKNTSAGMEESCLLGIDCNERTTIGLVVPILADTTIHLDGDG